MRDATLTLPLPSSEIIVHRGARPPSESNADADATPTQKQTLKALPSMSMRTFRMKLAKAFKITKAEQPGLRIWLKMPDGAFSELEHVDDTHDLAWWGIEHGSEILLTTSVP